MLLTKTYSLLDNKTLVHNDLIDKVHHILQQTYPNFSFSADDTKLSADDTKLYCSLYFFFR